MTSLTFPKCLALVAVLGGLALVPATASAGGSLHLDLPGFSFGVHDRHYYGDRYRYGKRHHWRHKKHYKRHHRRHHYSPYHYRGYGYGYYDRGYRSYGYAPRPRYYGGSICPTPGYSPYRYWGGNCYAHKDHFHCDG